MKEIDALVILSSTPNLGSVKIRLLVQHFGSACAAIDADVSQIAKLPGFGPKILEHWNSWRKCDDWKRELDIAEKNGVSLVSYLDKEYPKALFDLDDPPVLLYVKGLLLPANGNGIAIVGTRTASIYGMESAHCFAREIAAQKITVISGLARGIDTSAHEGALETGCTIAVIGSGLANIYPRENETLARKITENGALISTFSMLKPPDRVNFPQRNKIVSALSRAVLLIEGAKDSGAMITMEQAYGLKRKLFALPGRIGKNFEGNHSLIKQGKAGLVESSGDVLESLLHFFPLLENKVVKTKEEAIYAGLDNDELELLKQMPVEETSFEQLINITRLPTAKLNVLLMSLLLKKIIKEFPGKQYLKLIIK